MSRKNGESRSQTFVVPQYVKRANWNDNQFLISCELWSSVYDTATHIWEIFNDNYENNNFVKKETWNFAEFRSKNNFV